MNDAKKRISPAVAVIIMFGIISMMGDVVYESARSSNSQYLNLLGISAAKVGLVFGIGEFLGYFIRLISGLLSDKSGKHWIFMFLGYGMLLVVPLIGFTMNWNAIIILILMERIGKALRSPAKDTILSKVADKQVGVGFAFGLQEALDQIGAFIGPLIFTSIFYFTRKNGVLQYQLGYRALFIPFAILMLFLVFVFTKVKNNNLVPDIKKEHHSEHLQPVFWIYTAFTFFCTLGFVNFSTVGYHLKATNLMSDGDITLVYSLAMIADAVTALVVGKIYDKLKAKSGKKAGGLLVLMVLPAVSLLLPVLTLSHSAILIAIGMIVFGIVMGIHETVMRSAIADVTPFDKRGTGYGVFNTGYGLALMIGASLMGLFYDMNMTGAIIAFTFATEIIAAILYFKMNNLVKKQNI
ncbi:MAG: major Facilitator Superfamily protein [Oscillospiraceae bacterium]|jgi:MFS family permease|nr:major Facilitator Superfamily protein [Oscillospiraceae bacterium]